MMIRLLVYLLSVMFVMQVGCSRAIDLPEAKVTVKVVDEFSNPVENADVFVGFQDAKGKEHGIKDVAERGVTGTDGIFSASRKTIDHIAYGAEKVGYYKSYVEYHFSTRANGRWQPWNPEFTLVLRKIENPVAMYARDTHMTLIKLPVANKSVGFDLLKYDWVSPYGKGNNADIVFKYTGTYIKEDDFFKKLEVTFPNRFDGIQWVKEDRKNGSMLKLPRQAPENGYKDRLVRTRSRRPGNPLKEDAEDDNNYFFRVRSEEKNGKFIRAMYGKIQGDIMFDTDATDKATIIFKYYLNPDYTRNLEFDPKQNLFKELKSFEQIGLD